MSQRFEERTVPEHTEECLVERTCDICAVEADRPGAGQWVASSHFDVSQTTITLEEGSAYPEGRDTTRMSFDICPTCFKNKLIPFMATHGAKPRTNGED